MVRDFLHESLRQRGNTISDHVFDRPQVDDEVDVFWGQPMLTKKPGDLGLKSTFFKLGSRES